MAFSIGSAPEIELPIPAPASLCQASRDVTKTAQEKIGRAKEKKKELPLLLSEC